MPYLLQQKKVGILTPADFTLLCMRVCVCVSSVVYAYAISVWCVWCECGLDVECGMCVMCVCISSVCEWCMCMSRLCKWCVCIVYIVCLWHMCVFVRSVSKCVWNMCMWSV